MRPTLLVLSLLAGCGAEGAIDTQYRLEGECVAPEGAASIAPIRMASWSCELGAGHVVIDSQAGFDALSGLCMLSDARAVDFAREQLVLVNGQGGNGGGTTVNFVVDDGAQLQIGLTFVPAGYRFANLALIMPRNQHPVVLRTCNQVCVRGCDRAIP